MADALVAVGIAVANGEAVGPADGLVDAAKALLERSGLLGLGGVKSLVLMSVLQVNRMTYDLGVTKMTVLALYTILTGVVAGNVARGEVEFFSG